MPDRVAPYSQFNFSVNLGQGMRGPDTPLGGFSDVSGLSTDIQVSEYRVGNSRENHVEKHPGLHKVGDVTLKRGIVNSSDLWQWVSDVRLKGIAAQKDVVITLRDESQNAVQSWKLRGVIPLKYTGPTLAGKGGDIAMEELVLSAQALEINQE
jgi:phage tail-like protein